MAEGSYVVEEWNLLWWRSVVKYTEMVSTIVYEAVIGAAMLASIAFFFCWIVWEYPRLMDTTQIGLSSLFVLVLWFQFYLLVKEGSWSLRSITWGERWELYSNLLLINSSSLAASKCFLPLQSTAHPEDIDSHHREMEAHPVVNAYLRCVHQKTLAIWLPNQTP
jgi:hypothetical protein